MTDNDPVADDAITTDNIIITDNNPMTDSDDGSQHSRVGRYWKEPGCEDEWSSDNYDYHHDKIDGALDGPGCKDASNLVFVRHFYPEGQDAVIMPCARAKMPQIFVMMMMSNVVELLTTFGG
ncbi:hypothetical protein N0V88_005855 [Collariella sp. IMI 366227]|nr:hypothetical protein N0V88_005855 [Collariella sp. IMI 366227]